MKANETFILVSLLVLMNKGKCSNSEVLLRRRLYESKKHMWNVRPVINDTDKVVVTLGLTLSQIIDLDAKHQVLKLSVFIRQVWYNPYLQWNASKYNGVKSINVHPKKMWLPDITLYNTADSGGSGGIDNFSTRVIVHHTGMCVWLAPTIFKSKCEIDIEHFPFDSQKCNLKFGSWTFDGNKLDVQSESTTADLSKYSNHVEWKLVNMTAKRNVVKYICCDEPYPDVTFTLQVKRRSLFYLINLIAPLIILTFLSCMTFIVPFESGERVSLSITVLLSMTVFMLLVQNMIPSTSETIPLIGKFYTAASVEIAFAIIISCLNLRLFYTNPKFNEIPLWMKKIISGRVFRWFGMQQLETPFNDVNSRKSRTIKFSKTQEENENELFIESEECSCSCNAQYIKRKCQLRQLSKRNQVYNQFFRSNFVKSNVHEHILFPRGNGQVSHETETCVEEFEDDCLCQHSNGRLIERLHSISRSIKILLQHERSNEKLNRERNEWRQIAIAFDKICFYSFLFLFTSTTLFVFSNAPEYVP